MLPQEEPVEMTFDTSFHEPLQAQSEHPVRPELRSSTTMPTNIGSTAVGAMALEPNAWADDEHRHDGEISMTFE